MIEFADRHVRLDRTVCVPRDVVGVFEHVVGFGECLLGVTFADSAPVSDVRVRLREEPWDVCVVRQVRMDQVGALDHGRFRVEERREHLVFDLDQLGGLHRLTMASCNDRGDLLPDESDVVLGEDVAVFHVHAELVREVRPCGDANDAARRLGFRRIDGNDPRIGVRALHDRSVQQAGTEVDVVDELCRTTDLVEAIDPDRWGANGCEFIAGGLGLEGVRGGHSVPPLPALRTASMIGSYPVQRHRLPASAS